MRTIAARRAIRSIAAFLALFTGVTASTAAGAMLPEGGWYWNPNEGGRGYNIEIQDNVMFMAAFAYRPDGSQVWYAGSGVMSSDRQVRAELFETSGGQCFGCAFRGATTISRGFATVTFTSERAATITLLGTTVNVVRQDWSGVGTLSRDALYGEWSTTEGDTSFPLYSGERITLDTPVTSSGTQYAGGNRTGSTSSLALASYDAGVGGYYMLLDSSTSYYRFYVFTPNAFNHFEGLTWLYLKSSTLSGSGTFLVAHRTKSGSRVRNGIGPGISKSRDVIVDRDSQDAQLFAQRDGKAAIDVPDAAMLEAYRSLAARLEAQMRSAP